MFKNIAVTGGAGFIGSNFIHFLLKDSEFSGNIVNIDKLTYAGHLENLEGVEEFGDRYRFAQIDICDFSALKKVIVEEEVDCIIHFAAESHVDQSIESPRKFLDTNIIGTFNILEVIKGQKKVGREIHLHHVSTDEVYGSLGPTGLFHETTSYDPKSPYSASKAASDHLVRAYQNTYGQDFTMSNCSNNYGPYQFPEKMIPVMIFNMIRRRPLPVYGDGKNIRDWIHVSDHNRAVWEIVLNGKRGETYNIGGNNEWTNIDLVHKLCEVVAEVTNSPVQELRKLITFVSDRPGHDKRYAIDSSKIENELSWKREYTFEAGLRHTVEWYIANELWCKKVLASN
jgi:dTDP-glucose 4,6-dehydratase